eukprot:1959902-Ditylum_brightwellii.AAC.1
MGTIRAIVSDRIAPTHRNHDVMCHTVVKGKLQAATCAPSGTHGVYLGLDSLDKLGVNDPIIYS